MNKLVAILAVCLVVADVSVALRVVDGWTIYNGKRYRYFPNAASEYPPQMTFDEASTYCQNLGGHLATPKDADENRFIATHVIPGSQNRRYTWIGLSNTGVDTFKFVDDASSSVNPASPTDPYFYAWDLDPRGRVQPDYPSSERNCVGMLKDSGNHGHWADFTCDTVLSFVCEAEDIFWIEPSVFSLGPNQEQEVKITLRKPIICPDDNPDCTATLAFYNKYQDIVFDGRCGVSWSPLDWQVPKTVKVRSLQENLMSNNINGEFVIEGNFTTDATLYYQGQSASMHINNRELHSSVCKSTGDPHLTSLDGRRFNYHVNAAVNMLTTCSNNNNNPTNYYTSGAPDNWCHFSQAYQYFCRGTIACNCGVAAKEGPFLFRLDMCPQNGQNRLNVQATYYQEGEETQDQHLSPESLGFKINRVGRTYVVSFPSGITLKATTGGAAMNIHYTVPGRFANQVGGLCGNFNGRASDDTVTGPSFIVSDQNSLFTYSYPSDYQAPSDEDTDAFDDPTPAEEVMCDQIGNPTDFDPENEDHQDSFTQTLLDLSADNPQPFNVDNSGADPIITVDADLADSPISEADAVKVCTDAFTPIQLAAQNDDKFKAECGDMHDIILECAFDYMALGHEDPDFVTDAVAQFSQDCIATLHGGNNDTIGQLCPCENGGVCLPDNGGCSCTSGWIGDLCEIDADAKPGTPQRSSSLIDVRGASSQSIPNNIAVESTGIDDASVKCHYSGGAMGTVDGTVVSIAPDGTTSVSCPLASVLSAVGGDERVVNVRLSNGDGPQSDALTLTIFDSACTACDANGCTEEAAYCDIDNVCRAVGEKNDDCGICADGADWSRDDTSSSCLPSFGGSTSFNVDENSATGTPVGQITISIPEHKGVQDTVVLSTSSPSFAIGPNGGITVSGPINHEATPTITLTITADDTTIDKQVTHDVEITVGDINEAPTFTVSGGLIQESATNGDVAATFVGSDPDGDSLTYSLETSNVPFSISGNTLIVAGQLNHETTPEYTVSVDVTDGALTFRRSFKVFVLDSEEALSDITISVDPVAENAEVGTTVGTVTVTDSDESGETVSFTVVEGPLAIVSPPACTISNFECSVSVRLAAPLDFETDPNPTVTIRATDSSDSSIVRMLTFSVTDANDAPTGISLAPNTMIETATAGTIIGTLQVEDPDAQASNYVFDLTDDGTGLSGDHPFAIFTVIGDQVMLLVEDLLSASPDPWVITVKAIDTSDVSLTVETQVQINIVDGNDAPEFTRTMYLFQVPENADDTFVGMVPASDPDTGDQLTYAFATPQTDFAIDSATGEITTAVPLNYENQYFYSFQVTVTDGEFTDSALVRVVVQDENDAPRFAQPTATMQVDENSDEDTVIGSVSATDEDATDNDADLVYTIVSGPTNLFGLNGNQIVVKGSLDYESAAGNEFQLSIRASDDEVSSTAIVVTIQVQDVDEAPVLQTSNLGRKVFVDQPVGSTLVDIECIDPDTGDASPAYSMTSSTGVLNQIFSILPSLGTVKVVNVPSSVAAKSTLLSLNGVSLTVTCTDGDDSSLSTTFSVPVSFHDGCNVCADGYACDSTAPTSEEVDCGQCKGPGFDGPACDNNIDDCVDNTCVNGATCVDGIDQFFCDCAAGFGGDNCEINVAGICDGVTCSGNGQCDAQIQNGAAVAVCICEAGFSGPSCSDSASTTSVSFSFELSGVGSSRRRALDYEQVMQEEIANLLGVSIFAVTVTQTAVDSTTSLFEVSVIASDATAPTQDLIDDATTLINDGTLLNRLQSKYPVDFAGASISMQSAPSAAIENPNGPNNNSGSSETIIIAAAVGGGVVVMIAVVAIFLVRNNRRGHQIDSLDVSAYSTLKGTSNGTATADSASDLRLRKEDLSGLPFVFTNSSVADILGRLEGAGRVNGMYAVREVPNRFCVSVLTHNGDVTHHLLESTAEGFKVNHQLIASGAAKTIRAALQHLASTGECLPAPLKPRVDQSIAAIEEDTEVPAFAFRGLSDAEVVKQLTKGTLSAGSFILRRLDTRDFDLFVMVVDSDDNAAVEQHRLTKTLRGYTLDGRVLSRECFTLDAAISHLHKAADSLSTKLTYHVDEAGAATASTSALAAESTFFAQNPVFNDTSDVLKISPSASLRRAWEHQVHAFEWYQPELTRFEAEDYLSGLDFGNFVIYGNERMFLAVKLPSGIRHDEIELNDQTGAVRLNLPDWQKQPTFPTLAALVAAYSSYGQPGPYVLVERKDSAGAQPAEIDFMAESDYDIYTRDSFKPVVLRDD